MGHHRRALFVPFTKYHKQLCLTYSSLLLICGFGVLLCSAYGIYVVLFGEDILVDDIRSFGLGIVTGLVCIVSSIVMLCRERRPVIIALSAVSFVFCLLSTTVSALSAWREHTVMTSYPRQRINDGAYSMNISLCVVSSVCLVISLNLIVLWSVSYHHTHNKPKALHPLYIAPLSYTVGHI